MESMTKVREFLQRPEVMLLGKVLFFVMAANVFMQYMQRASITDYKNWDNHHAVYMSSPKEVFNSEVAVDGFQTYGPVFKYVIGTVGPYQENWNYYFIFVWMAIWLGLFYVFLKSCEIPNPFLLVGILLGGFNFPSFTYAPWLIILFCLSHPSNNLDKVIHVVCGLGYVSVMLMFKFSYGFIAFVQVLAWAFLAKDSMIDRVKAVFAWGGSLALMTVGLYFVTTDGTLSTLIDYVKVSFVDASSYTSLVMFPLEFMEGDLVYYWPFILFGLWLLSAGIKTSHPSWWMLVMLLPVSYAEFKHSYVRCDYSNLKGTFFVTGVLVFCLGIRYFHQREVRWITGSILCLFILNTFLGALPRNVPWRHPRLVWLNTPQQDNLLWSKAKLESKTALESHLSQFEWVEKHVGKDSLAASPAALCLSLLSPNPHTFKSAQSYYNIPLNEKFDIESLKKLQTKWVLFENRIIDLRFPASHGPSYFKELLANYELVEHKELQFLLTKKDHRRSWKMLTEKSHALKGGVGSIPITLSNSGIGFLLKSEPITDFSYKLQKFLLRGERLKVEWKDELYFLSLKELQNGVFIVPKLESFWEGETDLRQEVFKFNGPWSRDFENDPVQFLPKLDLDLNVKLEVYQLVK